MNVLWLISFFLDFRGKRMDMINDSNI